MSNNKQKGTFSLFPSGASTRNTEKINKSAFPSLFHVHELEPSLRYKSHDSAVVGEEKKTFVKWKSGSYKSMHGSNSNKFE